ncbi:MAG: HypC/HybG/HupF family hydrogenase formation chaperone [Nitrospirae bacterium]|nr:HypC/HybG/HupF family hydrogenase formation chaperone [Nitrospirota bacterium]
MCLAIPGKVLEIEESAEPRMGKADFGGIQKRVCLEWIPDVKVGDYVIVHVGFAISKMDEAEALKTLKLFEQIDGALEELKIPEPEDHRGFQSSTGGPSDAVY